MKVDIGVYMGIRDNFKKGTVEMILMTLLREEDMYGYQLSQLIAKRSDHIITIPEGSMYPTLYKLVDNGYVSSKRVKIGERLTRIYYHLEPSGFERVELLWNEYRLFYSGLVNILDESDAVLTNQKGE